MKQRGGAFVELVLWMAVFSLLVGATIELGRLCVWRLRLISVTRLAATLVGTGRVSPEIVEAEVRDYFQHWPGADRVSLEFSVDRFLGVPSAPFYKLMSARLRLQLPTATLDETARTQQEENT